MTPGSRRSIARTRRGCATPSRRHFEAQAARVRARLSHRAAERRRTALDPCAAAAVLRRARASRFASSASASTSPNASAQLVELRNFTETLEEAVKERTRALEAENEARKQVEELLRQAQKMEAVGQLTGGVAHDFNNLLTIVLGGLDMIGRQLAELPPSPAVTRMARAKEMALQGAQRAATLTSRLLAFSRQQALDPQVIDANKLVAGTCDFLRRTLGEAVSLETVLAGGLWRCFADPHQLENALLNLALNARDAMPNGGKVTIETANCYLDEAYVDAAAGTGRGRPICHDRGGRHRRRHGPADARAGVRPVLHDQGCRQRHRPRTEPGLRLRPPERRATCASTASSAKARRSKSTFPATPATRTRRNASTAPQDTARAIGAETILVVEDDEALRSYTTEILAELGYRVLAAHDGASALQMLESNPVDLLFTDVVMPGGMNGRQLADEAVRRRPGLKVLFTTGYTRNAIVHHGRLDAGVQMIGKPFSFNELGAKVRALLDD